MTSGAIPKMHSKSIENYSKITRKQVDDHDLYVGMCGR